MKCPRCQFNNPSDSKFCKECGSQLLPSKDAPSFTKTLDIPKAELSTGTTFAGRYQVIEELGAGGMGHVYRALDKEVDEEVALKLLKPEIAADEKIITRFQNELKFAHRVTHRNVCRMHHLSREGATPYIVMEYVAGEDLKSLLKRIGKIPLEKVLGITKQVCEGLAEAHRLGVVHRDLKPQNIMVDKEGNAKVMDFGIARTLEAKGVTQEGMIIGTPEYMSPEQVEGREADQCSDIYSLGVILYEMVTGSTPFKGDTALSLALKHKTEVPLDPKKLNRQIPEGLSRMILRCMEKQKEARYQSAEEVLLELAGIEEEISIKERVIEEKEPFFKPVVRTLRKRKIFETLAAFIGGGWLILEVVHWILIDHYHLPERTLDVAIVTLLGALVCTLVWRFFGGVEREARKLKVELIVIPLVILVTAFVDVHLILNMGETGHWRGLDPEKLMETRSRNSVAVMHFKNITGDADLDIWKRALPESIITDLSQSRRINVLSGNILYGILKKHRLLEAEEYSAEDLQGIAAEGEVAHILQGSLTRAGDIFRVDYTLQKISTTEILGSGRVEGKGEESLFTMVDELTRKIKENFKFSEREIADDIDKEVGTITTSSLEAYKLYIQGNLSFSQSDYQAAVQYFQKALEIDPGFATAYRSMSMAYSNLGLLSKRWDSLQKAVEWSDRVSERERYRIQAEYYRRSEKTYDQAITAFKKLLELYPDEGYGRNNLANVYRDIEEWDKAIEQFQWHIQNRVGYFQPYANLANIYNAKGMYEKAGEVLELGLERIPDHPRLLWYAANTPLCQGKFDLALAVVNRALSLNPSYPYNVWMKGDIFLCQGELRKAEEQYLQLKELEDPSAHLFSTRMLGILNLLQGRYRDSTGQFLKGMELAETLDMFDERLRLHLILAHSYLSQGKTGLALKECEKAWQISTDAEDLPGQRKSQYFKGLVYIGMNSMKEARSAAEQLKRLIQEGMNRKDIRYYHNLMGRIALEEGKSSKAIDHLNEALSTLPYQYNWYNDHTLFFVPLAFAYYKAGDLDKAQTEYERTAALTVSRILFSDIYAKCFYMLGKICEQKGWPGKAIEHYEKFLNLWKDADPGFPEVEDAKKRLASLQTQ